MQRKEDYRTQIFEWEYCYCRDCGKIRYSSDLEATEHGIRCVKCGSYDLEGPRWVRCPHHKMAVKCARAGRGLVKKEEYWYECEYRCRFLES